VADPGRDKELVRADFEAIASGVPLSEPLDSPSRGGFLTSLAIERFI
jgi:hypothetical protein